MSVNLEIIGQRAEEHYASRKDDLKDSSLDVKFKIIATEIFNTLPQEDHTEENFEAIKEIVEKRILDAHIATTLTPVLKSCRLDISGLPSTSKIGYLSAQIIQKDPQLNRYITTSQRSTFVSKRVTAALKDPSFKIDAELAVLAFANQIEKASEKSLLRDFPFLNGRKDLVTLEDKKAFLIRKYSEYQSAFANHDLTLLPKTVEDFEKVTDWNSCNETFQLYSQPLSAQARTFIAVGHLVDHIRIYSVEQPDPAIMYFIHTEHPSIRTIPVERLALWETFASTAVEIALESSCQKTTTLPSSVDVEIEHMISLPKIEVKLFGEDTPPVILTQQGGADLHRIGNTTLTIRRDGKETVLKESPSPAVIYSELAPVMSGDPEGSYVLQEIISQTVQNAGSEWLCDDVAAKTGLSIGDASQILTFTPDLTERIVDKVNENTVRVTFKFDMIVKSPRLMNNMAEGRIDPESLNLPNMPGKYQFIFSCEAKRNEDGKWIAQELQQHSEIPASGKPSGSSAIPLPELSAPIAVQNPDAKGKEEDKKEPASYELKEAIPVISNTPPEGVKIRESEKKPLSFNGNKKNFSDTKLDMGQLMARYYKEPSPNSSAQSSSSQPTKEPQSSNAVEPTLKDYWYNKHWVNYEKVPETFSDSKKLNSIIEKLNILQGRTEIEGRPDLKIRDRDLLLFTQYACYRLEILKDKLKKGTLLSQSEKNEFRMMADFTKNRKKQLLKVVKSGSNLNGSQATELDLLIEKRKEVIAPSVKIKANPSPVDFHTKHKDEKNESDVIDPALAEAITNAKKNETINPGIIKEKEKTEQKVRFENTARRIDIDVKKENPIITESAPDLKPSHELTKKRRQNSSASNRGFGFY